MGTYKITIAGLERELELFPVSDKLDIAAFIMFGDVEITEASAKELLKICPEHDVVVTAEAKGIPLCYEMARQGCKNYVVARKGVKVYMRNPLLSYAPFAFLFRLSAVCSNALSCFYQPHHAKNSL